MSGGRKQANLACGRSLDGRSGRWRKQADHVNFIVKLSIDKLGPALKTELLEAVLPVQGDRSDVSGVHGQGHLPDPQLAASIGQSFDNESTSDAECARAWLDVHALLPSSSVVQRVFRGRDG